MSDKNIYQRINAVMNDCEYLQKTKAQQGKGIKYDEVNAMLRDHLIKHGIVIVINQEDFSYLHDVGTTNQKVYQGKYTMDLVNIDKPEEKVTHTVFAQGMDGGDKAPGKAQTYAVKIMLTKAFGIETGEDEESRSERLEKNNTISQEEYDQLSKYCVTQGNDGPQWTNTAKALMKAYKINNISDLPKVKFYEALSRAKNHANNS